MDEEYGLRGRRAIPLDTRRFVLSISGGGFRGLYSSLVLSEIHRQIGRDRDFSNSFDLIAGTSIGGAIAGALAVGVPPARVSDSFLEFGPQVFDSLGGLVRVVRTIAWSAHDSKKLRRCFEEVLGPEHKNKRLSDIDARLLICAVKVRDRSPAFFMSRGMGEASASEVPLLDAIMASTAAPTFFRPHTADGEVYVDGGLIANAPDIAALGMAIDRLGWHPDSIIMLSVGTAEPMSKVWGPLGGGLFGVLRGQLVRMTLRAQQELAKRTCRQLMGPRWWRIDETPSDAREILTLQEMDNASGEAIEILSSLAAETCRRLRADQDFQALVDVLRSRAGRASSV